MHQQHHQPHRHLFSDQRGDGQPNPVLRGVVEGRLRSPVSLPEGDDASAQLVRAGHPLMQQNHLAAATRAGSITPETADEIMMRDFDDQQELDRWLREAWAEWFPGEPCPA